MYIFFFNSIFFQLSRIRIRIHGKNCWILIPAFLTKYSFEDTYFWRINTTARPITSAGMQRIFASESWFFVCIFCFSSKDAHSWYLDIIGAHVMRNRCFSTCSMHLIRSRVATNRMFFFIRKDLFFFKCAELFLSYHLI